jgi:ferritin
MIGKAMQDAINEQINKELYSSYLYLSMAAYFEDKNLPGFAKWMHMQDGEEREHAMKLYEFLVDRGGRVALKAIAAPESDWKSALELFKQVAAHEAAVTASIHNLYEVALKEKDYAAQAMLQWFITEQVEEEKNATEIVSQLEMVEARGTAIMMLDHRLGKRGE